MKPSLKITSPFTQVAQTPIGWILDGTLQSIYAPEVKTCYIYIAPQNNFISVATTQVSLAYPA